MTISADPGQNLNGSASLADKGSEANMATLTGIEEALQAMQILEKWRDGIEDPFRGRLSGPWRTTWEEERRELLEGVLEFLAEGGGNPDRVAACEQLLRHLAYGSHGSDSWISQFSGGKIA